MSLGLKIFVGFMFFFSIGVVFGWILYLILMT